jgi:outer membrane lipoprotein LolB
MQSRHVKRFFRLITSLSIINLSACTHPTLHTQPLLDTPQKPLLRQTPRTVSSLSAWHIIGAVAAKKKTTAWSASLDWQQQDNQHYTIRLFGPLGNGTVILEKNGALTTYQDGKKTSTSPHAEALLQKETGLYFPLHQLQYWIKGLAAPGKVQLRELDANKHLITLKQAGYTLRYRAYASMDGITLPTKIQLENANGIVKIVIKQWQLAPLSQHQSQNN